MSLKFIIQEIKMNWSIYKKEISHQYKHWKMFIVIRNVLNMTYDYNFALVKEALS
jgi:hypothetical protein